MSSFDIEVTDPATGEVTHVEVTTANPKQNRGTSAVTRVDELTSAVRHATDKLAKRERDGAPIQGNKEVSIQVDFQSGELPGKKGSREVHDGQGGYTVHPPNTDKEIHRNIVDDFQRDLPKIGGSEKLDVVRLTDPNGNLVAEFKRDPNTNTWTRVTQ
jgi:hypothetical protein